MPPTAARRQLHRGRQLGSGGGTGGGDGRDSGRAWSERRGRGGGERAFRGPYGCEKEQARSLSICPSITTLLVVVLTRWQSQRLICGTSRAIMQSIKYFSCFFERSNG